MREQEKGTKVNRGKHKKKLQSELQTCGKQVRRTLVTSREHQARVRGWNESFSPLVRAAANHELDESQLRCAGVHLTHQKNNGKIGNRTNKNSYRTHKPHTDGRQKWLVHAATIHCSLGTQRMDCDANFTGPSTQVKDCCGF